MKFLLIHFLFLIATNVISQSKQYDIAIKNVNIIPCQENIVLKNKTVLINGNRIVEISNSNKVSAKTTINGKGKYLIPGLADMHVHFPDEGLQNFFDLNRSAGVMYLRSMRGDAGKGRHPNLRDSLAKSDPYALHLILSAPPFYKKDGLKNPDSLIQSYKKEGYDLIKILSVENEQRFSEILNASNENKMKVAGHNPVNLIKTLCSGFGCIEHLDGYYSYLKKDSLDFAIDKTIRNNVYNCATIDWYSIFYMQATKDELQKRAGLQFISKKQLAAWDSSFDASLTRRQQLEEPKQLETTKRNKEIIDAKYLILKKLYSKNAKMLLGADATGLFQVPGYSVYEEMYHYKKAGISNFQILNTATYAAAQYCGEENLWGSIATGKLANLVLLSKNPLEQIENIDSVEGIIVNGNWLNKEHLNKKLTY
jgi:hypothetical protein